MTRLAPDWRPVVLRGVSGAIECERDANARPGGPAWSVLRWRWRAHSGELPDWWRPGAPPDARPAKRREALGHVMRVAAARALLTLVILLVLCGT